MSQLLKTIHRPCCERFLVETIFFLPGKQHHNTEGRDIAVELWKCIFRGGLSTTGRLPSSAITLERRQISHISLPRRLTPKQSGRINSAARGGEICFYFILGCHFKRKIQHCLRGYITPGLMEKCELN